MKLFARPALSLAVPHDEKLAAARVAAARRCSTWAEIPPPIQRGSFFVDEEDRIFTAYRGAVWETGSAAIISALQPLFFAVDARNDVQMFERAAIGASSWTDYCERKARLDARARPPL